MHTEDEFGLGPMWKKERKSFLRGWISSRGLAVIERMDRASLPRLSPDANSASRNGPQKSVILLLHARRQLPQ